MHIIGSHVDSPRLNLKPNPLCEDGGLAVFLKHIIMEESKNINGPQYH